MPRGPSLRDGSPRFLHIGITPKLNAGRGSSSGVMRPWASFIVATEALIISQTVFGFFLFLKLGTGNSRSFLAQNESGKDIFL